MRDTRSRIISVASGKGGVGKTSCSLNLALCLSRLGSKVCLIDADMGLANIDVILGIQPKLTLEDVIFKNIPIEEVLVPIEEDLYLLPGSSGIPAMADLSPDKRKNFIEKFSRLTGYDFIIIDNSPGIAPSVLSFCLASPELIIISTPDPTSITDAYALLKSLKENGLRYPPFFVLNRASSKGQIKKVVSRLNNVCRKFLNLPLLFLGAVFEDQTFKREMELNTPLSHFAPQSLAGRCFEMIAHRILNRPRREIFYSSMEDFIEQSIIQFISRVKTSSLDFKNRFIRDLHSLLENFERISIEGEEAEKILSLLEEVQKRIRDRLLRESAPFVIGIYSEDFYMATMLEDLLKDKGYRTISIGEGTELEDINLIIFHHIPEKTNDYILNRILEGEIPVLLISSFRHLLPGRSIKAFLSSPFKIQDLYQEVERLLPQGNLP